MTEQQELLNLNIDKVLYQMVASIGTGLIAGQVSANDEWTENLVKATREKIFDAIDEWAANP